MNLTDKIKIDDLDEWGAGHRDEYYSDEGVLAWAGERGEFTLEDVFTDDNVSTRDKILLAGRTMPDEQKIRFAEACANRAVRKYALSCGIPEVETWARGWIAGERGEALREAAWDAADKVADMATRKAPGAYPWAEKRRLWNLEATAKGAAWATVSARAAANALHDPTAGSALAAAQYSAEAADRAAAHGPKDATEAAKAATRAELFWQIEKIKEIASRSPNNS